MSVDTFENRLRLQKLGFLAQEIGEEVGFSFSWYHHGPYSSSLAKMLYMGNEVDAFTEEIELNEQENAVIVGLNTLLGENLNDPHVLELYASLWYLLPNRILFEREIDLIKNKLREEKPQYNEEEVNQATERITNFRNQND